MAITRKPKAAESHQASGVDVDALINKGGSVARTAAAEKDGKDMERVNIRMPTDFLQQIDAAVKRRRIKTARHTWILEALAEKLDRETTASD